MLVAWDDTDSPEGGCTTSLVIPLLRATGLAPRGMPRLVRLNPNVAWKTRGNGAVAMELVEPSGPHVQIGEWQGNEIHAYPDGNPVAASEAWLERIWAVIEAHAEPDAIPGLVLLDEPPLEAAYWTAVQTFVPPGPGPTLSRHRGDGRALTGCMAALAWGGPPSSYELIAYRTGKHVGTPRQVDPEPLRKLDGVATFHTYDHVEDRPACIPNTACPVLVGLRGRDPQMLHAFGIRTLAAAVQEPVDSWLLWATNQASGDHVVDVGRFADAPAHATIRIRGTTGNPKWVDGGHLVVPLTDTMGQTVEAIAFEPTKRFRHDVASLLDGDEVVAVGALSDSLHLESLILVKPVPKRSPPRCEACSKNMKSQGAAADYKCRGCGATAPVIETPRQPAQWEVPVMARRHLHRPLDWGE